MKKTLFFMIVSLFTFSQISFAQEKRGDSKARRDSLKKMTPEQRREDINKYTQLNLSDQQFESIKKIQAESKKLRQDINKDNSLSADDKKSKLREMRRSQADKVLSLLNDEQKEKFSKMRRDRLQKKNDDKDED
jgi:hypothetical protein